MTGSTVVIGDPDVERKQRVRMLRVREKLGEEFGIGPEWWGVPDVPDWVEAVMIECRNEALMRAVREVVAAERRGWK